MVDHDHLILCRARRENPPGKIGSARQAFEEELLRLLPTCEALSVTVVPHLYDLTADGPALGRLRSLSGRLVVLSWTSARAAYWILQGAGAADTPGGDSREIRCLDLHDYRRPEACVEAIGRIISAAADPGTIAPGEPPTVEHLDQSVSARWYPVIDYDRCANCLECLNFCLFGVFELDASGSVRVEQPDACRPGCPACARVCPSGAIMFPEHAEPTIRGAALGEPMGQIEAASPLLPIIDSLHLALAEREAAKPCSTGQQDNPPSKDAGLDELVDELDKFEL